MSNSKYQDQFTIPAHLLHPGSRGEDTVTSFRSDIHCKVTPVKFLGTDREDSPSLAVGSPADQELSSL